MYSRSSNVLILPIDEASNSYTWTLKRDSHIAQCQYIENGFLNFYFGVWPCPLFPMKLHSTNILFDVHCGKCASPYSSSASQSSPLQQQIFSPGQGTKKMNCGVILSIKVTIRYFGFAKAKIWVNFSSKKR